MKYGPEDFNYTFVRTEEDEAAAADVEAGKNEPDDEQLDQPEKPSDAATAAAASSTPADDPLRRSSRAADESTRPYVYVPPKKYGLGGGRGGDGLSDDDGRAHANHLGCDAAGHDGDRDGPGSTHGSGYASRNRAGASQQVTGCDCGCGAAWRRYQHQQRARVG